ncbi:MAG: glycosyltransferase [Deltaproteobacteria bacterium]|jgi:glycosyltransferase involved in cell wall biosynthesis|nr:glycosyltransferase [Deltaproteobacteria bacterium]
MKILHIISQSPDFTGSGKYIQEIILQSAKNGYDNFLLAGAQADFKISPSVIARDHTLFVRFDGMDLGFPIPGMSDIMPYQSSVFSLLDKDILSAYRMAFEKKIKAAINRFKPDLIHTHHLWIVSALTRQIAKDIPMVTTCHGTGLRQHYNCPEISKEIIPDLQQIDRIIALSCDQKQLIVKALSIDPQQISIISGGYNKERFYDEPKSFEGTVELLYAGKISAPKGVPWLLKSLYLIRELPFRLHLAGNANDEKKLLCLSLADRLGPKAIYHGSLSHEDLSALMRKAHIFILPSFFEGLPLVLLEALACGCRIITTALPGVHEIFKTDHPGMVRLVQLPILETIDKPFKKNEKAMEKDLSITMAEFISLVEKHPQPDMAYVQSISSVFTWEKIFTKIALIYGDLS